MPSHPLRAYGYVRVSTEEQAREGVSLDTQKGKITAFAKLHDLDLLDILADEGASGKDLERPGLKRLLELIRGQEAETVVIYKLDRLSRRTRDLLFLVEDEFRTGNTRLLSLTEQIDTDTAMGKFFLTVMGALAQMERELISERTREALAFKKQRGDRLGTTPLGYRTLPDGTLEPIPEELAIVARIKKLRRRRKSYSAIARIFNQEHIPTKRGGRWDHSTVSYIDRNRRYQLLARQLLAPEEASLKGGSAPESAG